MKKTLTLVGLVFVFNATAAAKKYQRPSADEIAKSRGCFEELEKQGCGGPEGDPYRFRECLSDAQSTLDENCLKLMLDLYGSK